MALAIAVGGAGALWVIFDADSQSLRAFEMGRGEAIYLLGLRRACALLATRAPVQPGRARAGLQRVHPDRGRVLLAGWAVGPILATDWTALPAVVWITILYVALPATAVTFVMLRYATLRLPSAKVMAYTYLTPCWVILWEIALGQGVPQALVLPGVGLTDGRAPAASEGRSWRRAPRDGGCHGNESLTPTFTRSVSRTSISGTNHLLDRPRVVIAFSASWAHRPPLAAEKALEGVEVEIVELPEARIQAEAARSASGSSLHQITRPRFSWRRGRRG